MHLQRCEVRQLSGHTPIIALGSFGWVAQHSVLFAISCLPMASYSLLAEVDLILTQLTSMRWSCYLCMHLSSSLYVHAERLCTRSIPESPSACLRRSQAQLIKSCESRQLAGGCAWCHCLSERTESLMRAGASWKLNGECMIDSLSLHAQILRAACESGSVPEAVLKGQRALIKPVHSGTWTVDDGTPSCMRRSREQPVGLCGSGTLPEVVPMQGGEP